MESALIFYEDYLLEEEKPFGLALKEAMEHMKQLLNTAHSRYLIDDKKDLSAMLEDEDLKQTILGGNPLSFLGYGLCQVIFPEMAVYVLENHPDVIRNYIRFIDSPHDGKDFVFSGSNHAHSKNTPTKDVTDMQPDKSLNKNIFPRISSNITNSDMVNNHPTKSNVVNDNMTNRKETSGAVVNDDVTNGNAISSSVLNTNSLTKHSGVKIYQNPYVQKIDLTDESLWIDNNKIPKIWLCFDFIRQSLSFYSTFGNERDVEKQFLPILMKNYFPEIVQWFVLGLKGDTTGRTEAIIAQMEMGMDTSISSVAKIWGTIADIFLTQSDVDVIELDTFHGSDNKEDTAAPKNTFIKKMMNVKLFEHDNTYLIGKIEKESFKPPRPSETSPRGTLSSDASQVLPCKTCKNKKQAKGYSGQSNKEWAVGIACARITERIIRYLFVPPFPEDKIAQMEKVLKWEDFIDWNTISIHNTFSLLYTSGGENLLLRILTHLKTEHLQTMIKRITANCSELSKARTKYVTRTPIFSKQKQNVDELAGIKMVSQSINSILILRQLSTLAEPLNSTTLAPNTNPATIQPKSKDYVTEELFPFQSL